MWAKCCTTKQNKIIINTEHVWQMAEFEISFSLHCITISGRIQWTESNRVIQINWIENMLKVEITGRKNLKQFTPDSNSIVKKINTLYSCCSPFWRILCERDSFWLSEMMEILDNFYVRIIIGVCVRPSNLLHATCTAIAQTHTIHAHNHTHAQNIPVDSSIHSCSFWCMCIVYNVRTMNVKCILFCLPSSTVIGIGQASIQLDDSRHIVIIKHDKKRARLLSQIYIHWI